MDSRSVNCGNGGGGVHVDAVDVAGLDDAGLDARLRLIGQGRNRLEGFLAEAVAEKTRRSSSFDALNTLKGELRQSGHQAQRTMRSADQLDKLEATRDALVDSRINSEHARILGSAAESGPMDEAKMLAAAETQTPEQLRKTVRDHQNELAGDDGAKRFERQRKARMASFSLRDDGMWQLFALFDPTAAARIRRALNKATDDDWRADNRREHTADRHRRADALERLITRTVSGDGHEQPQGTTLLLMADYDLADNKLGRPRLADGTPLPPNEFHRLACDADILTGLFREADSEPIWIGQHQPAPQLRSASRPRSPRPGLHRLREGLRMVRLPPHCRMARRRPHTARQPGAGVPRLPSKSPPPKLDCRKAPRHRPPLLAAPLAGAAQTPGRNRHYPALVALADQLLPNRGAEVALGVAWDVAVASQVAKGYERSGILLVEPNDVADRFAVESGDLGDLAE